METQTLTQSTTTLSEMPLGEDRALPQTGSEKGDVMAYAADMYKALQLSKQREAKLQQDLAHAQNVSKEMGAASLYQYKEAAEKSIEKARLLKKAAMDAGNSEDILKADEEYMAALTAKNWSEQMIRQKEAGKTQDAGDQGATSSHGSPSETSMDPRAAAFMKSHPLIDTLNPSYDPEKHREVATYAMALEMNLQNEGREHEICSPQYFKKIEEYMTARFGISSNGSASGNSSSSTPSKTEGTKPTVKSLSPDEQRLCKIMKIKEEDYLKHREECTREYQERMAAGERYA